MDRNYCFRRKRHSYAACDGALAASKYIMSKKQNKTKLTNLRDNKHIPVFKKSPQTCQRKLFVLNLSPELV